MPWNFLSSALCFSLLYAVTAGATQTEQLPPWTPDANVARSEIPDVYKWQLEALVPSDEAWEEQAGRARKMLEELKTGESRLDSADGLADFLDLYFRTDELINRITLDANLKHNVDQISQEAIARHQRALSLTSEIMAEGTPLRQAILSRDEAEMAQAFKAVPRLHDFDFYISQLRRRSSHVLGPEAEKVLSLAGDNLWAQIDLNELPSPSEKTFSALMSEMQLPKILDDQGKMVQLSFSNYGRLRGSADRDVRRRAVEAMFATLKAHENTLASTLGGQAAFSVFLARARGYDTALDAYLDKDDIDPGVYRNLVATMRNHVDLLHRYVRLRKKVMGLDSLHLYDLYVPLTKGVEMDIPYPQAVETIKKALAPMGEDYLMRLQKGLDPRKGWIDVYPSKNKESGAFSSAAYGIHPYVKMNYQNGFDDMSTLAHEFGHALHSMFSMENQSYQSWRYPPFLAEIASTCNEMLLSRYMVHKAEDHSEKAWLLSQRAESIRTTIFRQALFADFELQLHELVEAGKPVTAEALNSIYRSLIETYYGPDYTIDPNDEIEWAYIPHFYYKYYVFTYATGLSSGIAISERIRNEVPGAREAYLKMLQSGCSRPPLEILKEAGVDLETPQPIDAAMKVFSDTLDQLDNLMVGE